MFWHTYLPITAHGAPSAQTAPRLKVLNLLHDGGWKLSGSGGTRNSSFREFDVLLRAYALRPMIMAIINAAITAPIVITRCTRKRDLERSNDKVLET